MPCRAREKLPTRNRPASPTKYRAQSAQSARRPAGDLTHMPLSWDDTWLTFRHPLDYVGSEGGGGVGGGPGISVGAALALKGSGRLPVAICGDGDFLMGVTAVWTAVHYRIPLLFVLANNRSFYNDELHQERMARARNGRSRTDGSASACRIPTSISPPWPARKARTASARSPSRAISPACSKKPSPRSMPAGWRSSMCGSSPAIRQSRPRR